MCLLGDSLRLPKLEILNISRITGRYLKEYLIVFFLKIKNQSVKNANFVYIFDLTLFWIQNLNFSISQPSSYYFTINIISCIIGTTFINNINSSITANGLGML